MGILGRSFPIKPHIGKLPILGSSPSPGGGCGSGGALVYNQGTGQLMYNPVSGLLVWCCLGGVPSPPGFDCTGQCATGTTGSLLRVVTGDFGATDNSCSGGGCANLNNATFDIPQISEFDPCNWLLDITDLICPGHSSAIVIYWRACLYTLGGHVYLDIALNSSIEAAPPFITLYRILWTYDLGTTIPANCMSAVNGTTIPLVTDGPSAICNGNYICDGVTTFCLGWSASGVPCTLTGYPDLTATMM